MFKETLYQQSTSDGTLFVRVLAEQGVMPGVKVDEVDVSALCNAPPSTVMLRLVRNLQSGWRKLFGMLFDWADSGSGVWTLVTQAPAPWLLNIAPAFCGELAPRQTPNAVQPNAVPCAGLVPLEGGEPGETSTRGLEALEANCRWVRPWRGTRVSIISRSQSTRSSSRSTPRSAR